MTTKHLKKVTTICDDLRVGDRLSRNGKSRVAKVHQLPSGNVIVKVTQRGARSATTMGGRGDEPVTVWREPNCQNDSENCEFGEEPLDGDPWKLTRVCYAHESEVPQ